ncbi:hypothetical protein NDU88_001596 [Pleurodeles waltl]|uniref:Uncharacterized protein n=1 Tax=Pleurodeles waltl TaxID=8319 RepID=A0AAV7U9W3_PLEWA|nr:hypothetical protein NDU88_001596 [Pleurodeles waltl]
MLKQRRWILNGLKVEESPTYTYMGFNPDSRGSFSARKKTILAKAEALNFAFNNLRKHLWGHNLKALLRATKAKLSPTLVYGGEIMLRTEAAILEKPVLRTYKCVFQLPRLASAV